MNPKPEWLDALALRVDRAFGGFAAALDAPREQLDHRSSGDRWTALEVGEHVALTNRFLLILLEKIADKCRSRTARGVAIPDGAPDFAALEKLGQRELFWVAPAHMLPTGGEALGDVLLKLAAQRDQILGRLREFPRGEGRLHSIRMGVVGPEARVDLYQLACFIALHLERHERQVRRALDEVRSLSPAPNPDNPRAQRE